MRTTRRIITVTMVALLLIGLAIAALASPRLERLQQRDPDRVTEQVEVEDPDDVTVHWRDRDQLRLHESRDAEARQHHDRDHLRLHESRDAEARQHHDRDHLRLHEPEDGVARQDRAEHRHGHEPLRPRQRHVD
jgi:hypothetical protein